MTYIPSAGLMGGTAGTRGRSQRSALWGRLGCWASTQWADAASSHLALCLSKSVLFPVDILLPLLGTGNGRGMCRTSGCVGVCQGST